MKDAVLIPWGNDSMRDDTDNTIYLEGSFFFFGRKLDTAIRVSSNIFKYNIM